MRVHAAEDITPRDESPPIDSRPFQNPTSDRKARKSKTMCRIPMSCREKCPPPYVKLAEILCRVRSRTCMSRKRWIRSSETSSLISSTSEPSPPANSERRENVRSSCEGVGYRCGFRCGYTCEEQRVLRDDAEARAQRLERDRCNVHAIDGDLARAQLASD